MANGLCYYCGEKLKFHKPDCPYFSLDTRHREWNRRYYAIIDGNKKPLLIVQANLYFPDCFKWDTLYKKGWFVHVVGQDLPKGVINEIFEKRHG